jgi:hypothetical protein
MKRDSSDKTALELGAIVPKCLFVQSGNLQSVDTPVSFHVATLFSNAPADEAVQVIVNKLRKNGALAERLDLQVVAITELQEFCLRTKYFWSSWLCNHEF